MSYDIEQQRQEEREARQRAKFAALTADLESILTSPSQNLDTLERQTDLLDRLLYSVMRYNLGRDRSRGYFDSENIELALRIQKQGMDTAKAASERAYMQAITSVQTGIWPAIPHPSPPPEK